MIKLLMFVIPGMLLSFIAPSNHKVAGHPPKGCNLQIGDAYAGGIIFYLDLNDACHGLVCAPSNQSADVEWNEAVTLCNSLNLNGYSDWRLPTGTELNEIYLNLYKTGVADFATNYYWSSTKDINGFVYAQYFGNISKNIHRYVYKNFTFHVRAVRAF